MEDSNLVKTRFLTICKTCLKYGKITQKDRNKPLCYLSSISYLKAPKAGVDIKLGLIEKPHPKFGHDKGATSQPKLRPSTTTFEMPTEKPVEDGTSQTLGLVTSG